MANYYAPHRGKLRHVQIAEAALGRELKGSELVHHADGNTWNNENNNLVICPDQVYHFHLHVRLRALLGCNNPEFRKCAYCKQWDNPDNMRASNRDRPEPNYRHPACARAAAKLNYYKVKAAKKC